MKRVKMIRVISFLTILSLVLSITYCILKYKPAYGIQQFESFYAQKNHTIDVLFVGTSHVYADINPATLWEERGISSFDLATGGAGTWNSYYAIKEALKTQTPEVIVFEVFATTDETEYKVPRSQMDAIFAMKFSKEKIKNIISSAPKEEWGELFLQFPYFRTRYSVIKKIDFFPFTNTSGENWTSILYPEGYQLGYKGAAMLFNNSPVQWKEDVFSVTESVPLVAKNEKYLKMIIDLARDEEIPLVFLVSPFPGITKEGQMYFNSTRQIAVDSNVEFVDTNPILDELKIDFDTDFAEEHHLNYRGMVKYSKWLAEYLDDKFDLPDRRDEKDYESWEINAQWEKRRIHNQILKEELDTDNYLQNIELNNYTIVASFDGEFQKHNAYQDWMEKLGLSQIDEKGGVFVIKDGTLNYEHDYQDTYLKHVDLGFDHIVIKGDYNEYVNAANPNFVLFNRLSNKKVVDGINLFIYDNQIKYMVDAIGLDANDNYKLVR